MSKYDQGIYFRDKEDMYTQEEATHIISERLLSVDGKPHIGIDLDGVLFSGYGDQADVLIHPTARETFIELYKRSHISLITARNAGVLEIINNVTDGQVDLSTDIHSFDKGCVLYDGRLAEPLIPLVSREYMDFLTGIDKKFFKGEGIDPTWDEVLHGIDDWCMGDPRWKSPYTRSFWYRYDDRSTKAFIRDTITSVANQFTGVTYTLEHMKQPEKKLGWSKVYPSGLTKAHPFLNYQEYSLDLYINDGGQGEKDTMIQFNEMRQNSTNPMIIVIGESPDECNGDMQWCRDNADILIPTIDETYQIFNQVLARLPVQ